MNNNYTTGKNINGDTVTVETRHALSLQQQPLKPYKKYTPSDIAWLGEIPEHWGVESFKNILTERNEKNNPIRSIERLSLSIDKGVTLYAEKTTNLDRFKDDLRSMRLPFPNPSEQTAIVNFLNYKLAKIDRFIRKKKQLIKLLNEQKAAIINQTVTKGLDPNARMRPSGIEWLGDIPEHWEVRKLKYSVKLNQHKAFDNSESENTKIALENIESKTGRIIELSSNVFEGVGTIFKKGDVLFGKLRPYLAKAATPSFEGSCVNEILVLTPIKEIWETDFLKFRMLSSEFIKIVDDSTYGSKMPRASWDFIGGLKISCPPLQEQTAIVSHIEAETAKLNNTISTIEKEISLVEEYKTALISEAVTGKIDVRDFEIPDTMDEESYDELEEELSITAEGETEYETEVIE